MKMKLCLILLIVLASYAESYSQTIDWTKASDWKIYKITDKGAFKYSLDTLKKFSALKLDDDSIKNILQGIVEIKEHYLWMGFFFCSCKVNGELRKILFSDNGAFFFDGSDKRYYLIPLSNRLDLIRFLNNGANRL